MTFTKQQLQAVITSTDLNRRIEALWQLFGYAVKELDFEGFRFWHLRLDADIERSHFLIAPEEMLPVQSLRGRYQ